MLFSKTKKLTTENKIYLYSKIKTEYNIDEYLLKTNSDNRRNIYLCVIQFLRL